MKLLWLLAAVLALAAPQITRAEHVEPIPAPDGVEFVAPVVPVTWKATALVPPAPPAPQITVPSGKPHKFPWGQCTWWVASKRPIIFSGHAKSWLANGARAGYRVAREPIPGAVVVTNESRAYGHVGYVEQVDPRAQTFTFSEANYAGLGVVTRRTMHVSDPRIRGFLL